MVSLTNNESKTIEFLIRNFSESYNINQLAKVLSISPGGMYKILKKLEKNKLLKKTKLGNNIFYKINFSYQEALDTCVFSLTEKNTSSYINAWIKDLEKLKAITDTAILFGSILTKEKDAKDVDILIVFKKENIKKVEKTIADINKIKSKKIHSIYQTKEDLVKNIKNKDKIILEEIKTGIVLWGRDVLVEAIKNGQD